MKISKLDDVKYLSLYTNYEKLKIYEVKIMKKRCKNPNHDCIITFFSS